MENQFHVGLLGEHPEDGEESQVARTLIRLGKGLGNDEDIGHEAGVTCDGKKGTEDRGGRLVRQWIQGLGAVGWVRSPWGWGWRSPGGSGLTIMRIPSGENTYYSSPRYCLDESPSPREGKGPRVRGDQENLAWHLGGLVFMPPHPFFPTAGEGIPIPTGSL